MKRIQKQKGANKDEDFSTELVKELDQNVDNLKKMLEEPSDLIIRKFTVRGTNNRLFVINDDFIEKFIV